MHLQAVPEVPDVVERAARGRAHEGVDGRAELDERVREMRAHEAVGAGHEDGATLVSVPEVAAEVVERGACPEGVVRHGPYASASVSKRTDSSGLGSLASAALTAASTLVVTGFAAVVGVVIAHEFGRTEETDGFFAAYGVFIVIVLASQAIRVAVLPSLVRAREECRRIGSQLFELDGLAVVLALSTLLVLAGLLPELHALASGLRGSARAALAVTAVAAVAYLPLGLALGSIAATLAGLVVYGVVLALWRPTGLTGSWGYLRTLR